MSEGHVATPSEIRARAERWLRLVSEPGPIDPLAAMHDDADAITEAESVIRLLLSEPETPAGLEDDHPIRLAFDETHGQDPDRTYSVTEVKRIVYPLVGFIRAQEAELVVLRARARAVTDAMIPGAYVLPTTVGYVPEPTAEEARRGRHRMIDPNVRVLCTCDRSADHDSQGEPVD